MDDSNDKKQQHNESGHLNDALMENLQNNARTQSDDDAETDQHVHDKLEQSSKPDSTPGLTGDVLANTSTVEQGPEISRFLKSEIHSDTSDHRVLDSASIVHGIGHMLQNARVSRNMSVEEVSRQLRISVQQVEAIEKENFDELPGRTFVRGFVRNYANLMQLDSAAIVQLLPGPTTTVSHIEHTPFKVQEMKPSSRNGKGIGSTVPIIVILVFLAATGFFLFEKFPFWRQAVQSSDMAIQNQNGQASVELQLPLSSLKSSDTKKVDIAKFNKDSVSGMGSVSTMNTFGTLTLNFSADAHVKVTDGNDDIIFEQDNTSGTQQRISGKKPLSIIISDASAVEVTYNDRLIDIKPYTNTQNGSAQLIFE
ncbi:cytoskeleton protein RodZ [Nitrosomonas marina]|uniref:Cytoskeleton protein RodZ n=1 Tax=Nitrosomonas marina TaxID=917 RepID=A0A1H9YK27_9PROT|nr:helix-turn-helix domain-containing protein [Nitrosomonas marina]SES69398.1 cytoskeleton protein RodZ [Nitrosomonas marina]